MVTRSTATYLELDQIGVIDPLFSCFDSVEVLFVFDKTANELKNQRDVPLG